jgi:hypothetical protein
MNVQENPDQRHDVVASMRGEENRPRLDREADSATATLEQGHRVIGAHEAPVEVVRGADGKRHLISRGSRTMWFVIAALVALICVIAVVAFVALRANPTGHPGQGDRQYTISPVQPQN